MYIDDADYRGGSVSHLGLQYDNGKINQCNNYKLRLYEPEEDELEVPEVKAHNLSAIRSASFRLCECGGMAM